MDTIASRSLGPRPERPIEIVRRFVGRKDSASPRHEARRPRLSEMGPQAAWGVTGLSVWPLIWFPFMSSRIHSSSFMTQYERGSPFGRYIPANQSFLAIPRAMDEPLTPALHHRTVHLHFERASSTILRLLEDNITLPPIHPPSVHISNLPACGPLNEY